MSSKNITPQTLRIFAGLLAKPGEESLAAIEEIAHNNHWLYDSIQELKEFSLEHWQGEHTRLFISGHPKTFAPPFESAYINGIMNGPACSEIEQFYHSIGLDPIEDLPADYLGIMLECAAYLLESNSNTEDNFQILWEKHLAQWVPKFASDLQEHSHLRLYQQLGLKLKELF
ncbi:MAG: molecular chaperone TorD family protein [Thiotrichaceae bacterium]|nr:molecular chaperone TorD family protein [Thiotrichaceae bacterium]